LNKEDYNLLKNILSSLRTIHHLLGGEGDTELKSPSPAHSLREFTTSPLGGEVRAAFSLSPLGERVPEGRVRGINDKENGL